jgi:hypothetical protein
MSQPTRPRWRLATGSYRDHRPDLGVPVATSVGPHPAFRNAPQVHALKPFGVFGVMSDRPVVEQRTAYLARLHKHARTIERVLDDLTATYPGQTLVVLCWCPRDIAVQGACHRRWAADWLDEHYGVQVPEVTP